MLKLVDINKTYISNDIKTIALKKINLEFRKNEFVSILGPSGCGKTTMLNIIGGLDKYSSGDLIINGISTKEYKDKDWDRYRNHSIGFVFQSYNLIPHLTILENVQLALTLSGISKEESKRRAIKVLTRVGLKDKLKNKPNQLSGGQMQRVAIARALVNDPEIILADEPTGALDSKSSIQIMNLLKEISKDKLIIMVTHNSELANEFSSRIVNLFDGEVTGDSNPFNETKETDDKLLSVSSDEELTKSQLKKKNKKKRMSFFTALSLSFKNLLTKKGRTMLVTFAGSIGIIGIALILAISSGFSTYVNKTQQDTLSTYPVEISNTNYNIASIMQMFMSSNGEVEGQDGKVYTKEELIEMLSKFNASSMTNDLKSFKNYLENEGKEEIEKYSSAIQYTYNNLFLNAYYNSEVNGLINTNSTSVFNDAINKYKTDYPEMENNVKFKLLQQVFTSEFSIFSSAFWSEMIDNESLLNSQYELVGEGSKWAKEYNEVNVVIDKNNQISDYTLYGLGLLNQDNLYTLVDNYVKGKDAESEKHTFEYDEIIGMTYKIIPESDFYVEKDGIYVDIRKAENKDLYEANIDRIYASGIEVKVAGIIRENENVSAYSLNTNIVYTKALSSYLIERANNTSLINLQKVSNTNLLTGVEFTNQSEKLSVLSILGYVDESSPSSIKIYPIDFEAKQDISNFITTYNKIKTDNNEDTKVISYTDTVGIMMGTISTIISAITYVLIAFVGVSLVVSSIMIGIITYISVLERTKEIGVLRSIGASKKDVSRVFTAESFIIGLLSGLFGILIAGLFTIPINIILSSFTNIAGLASLPLMGSIILVMISVVLTLIAGFIPSKVAAKKDPVVALREV